MVRRKFACHFPLEGRKIVVVQNISYKPGLPFFAVAWLWQLSEIWKPFFPPVVLVDDEMLLLKTGGNA